MTSTEGRIAHHDLCFGCGLANPFGLQLELAETDGGELRGRFFVKQDHQGADGAVHEGLLAAALIEAMALAAAPSGVAAVTRLELDVSGRAPVGTYVEVRAVDAPGEGGRSLARGELRDSEGTQIATGTASFAPPTADVPEHLA